MKILLVSSQDYLNHPLPSRHHQIFERLSRAHEVHGVHFKLNKPLPRKTNLIIHNCTLFPFKSPLIHYTLNAPYHFYKMNKIVKEGNFDIIVTGNILASTAVIKAGKKYRVPILFDLKDWFPTSAGAYLNWPLNKIVEKVVLWITLKNLHNSDCISTVSNGLLDTLKSYGLSSEIITNGVNTEKFTFKGNISPLKSALDIKEELVIGFSGSIERWYDLKSIIRAGEYLFNKGKDQFKIILIGSSLFTTTFKELKDYLINSPIEDKVIFTGRVDYKDLPSFINCMDVGVIPLEPQHWKKIALPNKFFEYSACNRLILSSNLPSMQNYARQNNYTNIITYHNFSQLCFYLEWLYNLKRDKEYPTFFQNHEKISWEERALEMEKLLFSLIK